MTRYRSTLSTVWVAATAFMWMIPAAAGIIDDVAARYQVKAGINGRFEQVIRSHDNGPERVYRGRYRYTSTSGLLWEVETPVSGRVLVDHDGEAETSGDLGGLAVFEKRTVGRLVVAMVALDESVLNRYFTIEQSVDPMGFRITLEARQRWKKHVAAVEIRGTRLVDEVRIRLPNGGSMKLSLTHE